MKKLLHWPHWKLFIIFFAIPFVLYLVAFLIFAVYIFNTNDISKIFIIPSIVGSIFLILSFTWNYTLATELQKKLHPRINISLGFFKVCLFFPAIYFSLFLLIMSTIFNNPFSIESFNPLLILIIIPLHFFTIFCFAYIFYIISKLIKSVEAQKRASFGEHVGEFFLFWFYPVGVWFLQPRINKIFEQDNLELHV